jgi:hypothetical protein
MPSKGVTQRVSTAADLAGLAWIADRSGKRSRKTACNWRTLQATAFMTTVALHVGTRAG